MLLKFPAPLIYQRAPLNTFQQIYLKARKFLRLMNIHIARTYARHLMPSHAHQPDIPSSDPSFHIEPCASHIFNWNRPTIAATAVFVCRSVSPLGNTDIHLLDCKKKKKKNSSIFLYLIFYYISSFHSAPHTQHVHINAVYKFIYYYSTCFNVMHCICISTAVALQEREREREK